MINWFANVLMAAVSLCAVSYYGNLKAIFGNAKGNLRLIINMSFFDNLAWITFAYAMLYIPIAIATGISEGYVAFAGILGLSLNHERLRTHQKIGFALAAFGVIVLAIITDR
jgi:uncharacterized membrane protein